MMTDAERSRSKSKQATDSVPCSWSLGEHGRERWWFSVVVGWTDPDPEGVRAHDGGGGGGHGGVEGLRDGASRGLSSTDNRGRR